MRSVGGWPFWRVSIRDDTHAVDLLVVTVGGPNAKLGRVVRVDQLELVTVAQDVQLAAVLVALKHKSMREGPDGAGLEL